MKDAGGTTGAPGPVSAAFAGDGLCWGWAMTERSGREVGDHGRRAPLTRWLPVLPRSAPPCRGPRGDGQVLMKLKLLTDSGDCTDSWVLRCDKKMTTATIYHGSRPVPGHRPPAWSCPTPWHLLRTDHRAKPHWPPGSAPGEKETVGPTLWDPWPSRTLHPMT